MKYHVLVGINYPVDAEIDETLRQFGQNATEARIRALDSGDPRDLAAAETAEQERQAAVAQAFESGLLKRAEPNEEVDDIPERSIPWLLEQSIIRPVDVGGEVTRPTLFLVGDSGKEDNAAIVPPQEPDAVTDLARPQGEGE